MVQSGTVTLLFTDLVSSTELMTSLGDDKAETLRQRLFGVLREPIAQCSGEEVKNLGDGLMVAFSSAVDGALCAVLMQQAVGRFNRRGSENLQIRVGLSVGEAISEDGDYFGAPVVEASRLCDAAEGGQILAADLLRMLVGSRGGLTFHHAGDLELKGLPEPVPTCEIAWQEVGDDRVELPPEFAVPGQVPFVGRVDERETLTLRWKRAVTGDRQVAMVSGEPGIGKTRLVAEIATHAYDDGATVLYGRCDEEMLVPYQPFVESLSRYVAVCSTEDLADHVEENGGDLGRLVPDLERRLPGAPAPARAEPETERYRLFEAVVALLRMAADRAPVLLVLDDLHWADRSSIMLLRHLIRRSSDVPLLILGTYRGADLERSHPLSELLAELRHEEMVERVTLRGLDAESLVEFMERAGGQALGPNGRQLAEILHRETEGHPFFAAEILRHLFEVGAITQRDGRWTYDVDAGGFGIPEGVREVIGHRLGQLSEEAERVLGVAAVIGRSFDLGLLEAITDLSEDQLVDVIDEALSRNVVVEHRDITDRFEFAHALVRTALYENLSVSRRVRLHRKIGETLERDGRAGERLAELAYHFFEASPSGGLDKAVEYGRRAGDQAIRQVAYGEAARQYERALQALDMAPVPDEAARLEILLLLGDARNRAGEIEPGKKSFLAAADTARVLGDVAGLTQAALGYGGSHYNAWNDLDDTTAVGLLEEALGELGAGDRRLRALALARLAAWTVFELPFDARVRLTDEALELSREIGDIETLADVLTDRHRALSGPAGVQQRIGEAAELMELGEQLGDKDVTAWGLHFWFRYLLVAGDVKGADEGAARYRAVARELRRPDHLWQAACYDVIRAVMRGDTTTAEDLAHEAVALGDVAGSQAIIVYGGHLVMMRWLGGRLEEIAPTIERLQEEQELPVWHHVLAFVYSVSGRPEAARDELDAAAEAGFDRIPLDAAWMSSLFTLGEAAARLGERDRAADLYETLLPYETLMATNGLAYFCGAVATTLGRLAGILERWEDAEQHFAAALDRLRGADAEAFVAATRGAYGSMLLDSGDAARRSEATALIEEALAGARRLGFRMVEDDAAAALARLR